MTAKSKSIDMQEPDNYVQICREDAHVLGIKDGETVRITSPRGSVEVSASITDVVEKGVAVMPFHWASGANTLTDARILDPVCKIPGLKLTGVKIEKL